MFRALPSPTHFSVSLISPLSLITTKKPVVTSIVVSIPQSTHRPFPSINLLNNLINLIYLIYLTLLTTAD